MAHTCHVCGAENRATAKFCHNCGARLEAPAAEPVATDESATAAIRAGGEQPVASSTVAAAVKPLVEPASSAPDGAVETQATPGQSAQAEDGAEAFPDVVEDVIPIAELNGGDLVGGQEEAALATLAAGAVVAQRFHVIAVETTPEGALAFVVEDRGVCRSCGSEAQASEEEPYCAECGAHLLDATAPWPQRRLRQITAGDAPVAVVDWEGVHLGLFDAPSPAPTPQAQRPLVFDHGVILQAGHRSDVGVARAGRPDEDSIFALTVASIYDSYVRPTLGLYVVADGMGGHGDGEIASRITVDVISTALLQSLALPLLQGASLPEEAIRSLIDAALQSANRRVLDNAHLRGNDMGSTVTLAFVIDSEVHIANVGDSRTYLWRGGLLTQITEDHSAVFQLYRQGILSEDEIYTHPRRNEIVRSVGFGSRLQVDHFRCQLLPGDSLLLCCDGLWEMLHNEGIADVLLAANGDPQIICDELIRRANLAGGDDNVSVVVVRAVS